MDWLKRNLFMVVSGLVALVAVGGSGYYFYSKIDADKQADADLTQKKADLDALLGKPVYPNQENLEAARQQQKQLQEFMTKARGFFGRFSTNLPVRNSDFGSYVVKRLSELQIMARQASVTLPTNYAFGFSVQRESLQYDAASTPTLYSQLEDVYALCDVLFRAKIYELLTIQRAPVSTNDSSAQVDQPQYAGDYLTKNVVTTNTSIPVVVSPYRVSWRSTSAELASALEALARAPNGFLVKWIRVEPAEQPQEGDSATGGAAPAVRPRGMDPGMMKRYGFDPRSRRPIGVSSPIPMDVPQPKKTGVVLKEKPIIIMLHIETIKFLPDK